MEDNVLVNFESAAAITSEQMRLIATTHDGYARSLMDKLGAWLRTTLQIDPRPGQHKTYGEAIGAMAELAYVCSLRMEPLGALGLIELDLALASPIIGALLGGVGKTAERKEVTDIEEEILRSVIKFLITDFNSVWQPSGIRFAFERREQSSQMTRLLLSTEKMLQVTFDVSMPEAEAKGTITLLLPAVALSTQLRQSAGEASRPRGRSPEFRERLCTLLEDATVCGTLQFEAMRLSAHVLSTVKPGTILQLPLRIDAVAQLYCNGVAVALARPVQVEERRGAQLMPGGLGNLPDLEPVTFMPPLSELSSAQPDQETL
jgi:flagellar motor switch protein FliM